MTTVLGGLFKTQFCLKNVRGRFLLECNFDVSKLNITFPCLYKECLNSWTPLVEGQHYPRRGVLLWQSIWNISFNQQLFY